MKRVVAFLFGLALVACSESGDADSSSSSTGVGSTTGVVATDLSPATTSLAQSCAGDDASVRVRLSGPDVFDTESETVLEVTTNDGTRVCRSVAAAVASRDPETDRITSGQLQVALPPGTYGFVVWQRDCDAATGCTSIDDSDVAATGAGGSSDRSLGCTTTVSLDGGRPLDIDAEYGADGCVHLRHVDGDGGVDGPVVYAAPAREGEEALARGTVELIDDCWWLGNDGGDAATDSLIMWPAGTTWDPQRQQVVLPDGRRIDHGTEVAGGGGSHGVAGLGAFASDPQVVAKATDCIGDDVIASGGDTVFVIQHPVEF